MISGRLMCRLIHTSQNQNFGTQGVSSSTTFSGTKINHACAVSQFDNMFHLFGGRFRLYFKYICTDSQLIFQYAKTISGGSTLPQSNGHFEKETQRLEYSQLMDRVSG